jgi:hypothetical protein
LAGGLIYTYEAGTTTPLATYQDLEGTIPNENPIVLDAAGRATAIRVTDGVAYKFVIYDADSELVDTIDNIIEGVSASSSGSQLQVNMTYCGTPGAQGFMGAAEIVTSATFPIDWDGASGSVQTNPGSDYIISVKKNGVEVGTITISSAGVFTFDTTGGATVSCVFGDTLSFHAPSSVGAAADFAVTLVGDLA